MNNLSEYGPKYMKLNTFSTSNGILRNIPSSDFLLGKLKKFSYFVDSKSNCVFGGYFLGRPLPLLICPSNLSGCLVFI